MHHAYEGNIRELQNIIEHAYVICRCDEIQEQCLPPHLIQDAASRAAAAPAAEPERSPRPLQPASGRFESLRRVPPEAARAAISQALEESGGIRSLAAANLGIDPSTLWRKMKKLGMR